VISGLPPRIFVRLALPHQGSAAAAEFQKILDHSAIVQNGPIGALARLGLARACALEAQSANGDDADTARAIAARV
jgi:hypothetical protein